MEVTANTAVTDQTVKVGSNRSWPPKCVCFWPGGVCRLYHTFRCPRARLGPFQVFVPLTNIHRPRSARIQPMIRASEQEVPAKFLRQQDNHHEHQSDPCPTDDGPPAIRHLHLTAELCYTATHALYAAKCPLHLRMQCAIMRPHSSVNTPDPSSIGRG